MRRTWNRLVVAVTTTVLWALPVSVSAQPTLTPWDAQDPVNKAETRQYLSLIWQAEAIGQQIDLGQFVFTNNLPDVMTLLVAPQKEVFEKLYEHRLDPHGLAGAPYGLNELMRDDPLVRAQFREFVLTDKISLGADADEAAIDKHLMMIMDAVLEQGEFKLETFAVVNGGLQSTKMEVVKNPGTIAPPTNPPNTPTQFKCDLEWWARRAFLECMNDNWDDPLLYLRENNLDPNDPLWPRKRRPVPRFDCDDFTDAIIEWLRRRLEEIYGPGNIKFEHLIFGWQCPVPNTNPQQWKKPIGHSMPLIERDGKFYLVDPYTGETYGPFNTREEAYKKALELYMKCPGGRPVGNPEYWPPGWRPGWEPKPWWTDREMQKRFCERLRACCGLPVLNPPNCPPTTVPGITPPTSLSPCNFRDYMPPGTFIDPGANCDR